LTRLFDLLVGVSRKIKSAFFFQSHDEYIIITVTLLKMLRKENKKTHTTKLQKLQVTTPFYMIAMT